jgi:hypothetical protein
MKHATRIKTFALGCALLTGGGVAAHLWAAPPAPDALAAVEACTARTPVDTTLYFDVDGTYSWDRVAAYMQDAGIQFSSIGSSVGPVRMCVDPANPSCRPFVLAIQSEKSNVCLTEGEAQDGQLRILGRLWTPPGKPVPPEIGARWGFPAENRSGAVYLLLRGTTAYAMYESNGMTAFAPAPAWKWSFCQHSAPPAAGAPAEWREKPGDEAPPCNPTHLGAQVRPGEQPGEPIAELTSYGWMACVNGCCRFYGSPPPGDGEEEEEEEHGRERPARPRPRPNR